MGTAEAAVGRAPGTAPLGVLRWSPETRTLTALPCWAWAEAAQAATASSASAQRLQTPRMTQIVPLPRPERLSTAGLGCAVPTTGGTAGASASLRPCCRAQDGKEVQ